MSFIQMKTLCYLTPFLPHIRDGITVMYHGQVMFVLLLMVEQNDHLILSQHEATCEKENKETRNDHALPVFWMLWNCLEDSREFYHLVMYTKPLPIPEENSFQPVEESNSWSKGQGLGFLPSEFNKRQQIAKKITIDILIPVQFQHPPQ